LLELSEIAEDILKSRYVARDANGMIIETSEELFRRVAKAIASAESRFAKRGADPRKLVKKWESIFFDLMTSLRFLPNSPTLTNAGRGLGQLSGCFVVPIEDSMESIFDSMKNAALIHKSGGGCFDEDTCIMTPYGEKKISDVCKGDKVVCYDRSNGIFVDGDVEEKYLIDVSEKDIVEIEFEDGYSVVCTADHPFLVENGSESMWIYACDLKDDMEIISFDI